MNFGKSTQEIQRRRQIRIHRCLNHHLLGMRLTAVRLRLGLRSVYASVYARGDGQPNQQLRRRAPQPFPEQVESLAVQKSTTSTAESDVIPSSNQGVPPNSTALAMGNVENATTHSIYFRDPSILVLADTGNHAATASSV